ncbi:DnaJ domain-containing protein [Planosporangium flavigriseum]|uniref:Molecular chaperone DnaJ n=1 Tax=Planosporangium flavigriseum TaxID=373681 RepID=A0A8J3LQ09_9ACTN|nr:DnaJ C-terminal domain-containing protein [Planosporangium flavigriseum]NJC67707.1 DnaJ domain-containing protein [Planosporangium flavigriseum]GIG75817.1 molecular chaperone DnaJ [Planosporangium flavigriseum]
MARDERDYYEILGVPRDASQSDIQRAYRQLARRNHPDVNKNPGAEERFKEITEAYDVLSDPSKRKRYDQFGHQWRQVPEDFETAGAGFRQRAGAGAGGPWGGGVRVEDFTEGGGFDFEDLFGSFFGGRGGRGAGFGGGFGGGRGYARGGFGRGPVPGADSEVEFPLTVEEAYHGGHHRVTLQTPEGDQRTLDVNIPAGVTDGQRIRLAGQGSPGTDGGPPGDLYLNIRIAPHPRYRVDGRDIVSTLPVAPWEAALGAKVPVQTPGGTVQLNVPAGSSCGRRLRLRGRGLPNPRGQPGDFYAEVRIMVPTSLSPAERDLFEQLARTSTFNPREGT